MPLIATRQTLYFWDPWVRTRWPLGQSPSIHPTQTGSLLARVRAPAARISALVQSSLLTEAIHGTRRPFREVFSGQEAPSTPWQWIPETRIDSCRAAARVFTAANRMAQADFIGLQSLFQIYLSRLRSRVSSLRRPLE